MPAAATITLRLEIADPVRGVAYSLQDSKSTPVGPVIATDAPVSFDVPIKVSPEGKFSGPYVRREGPVRRFVYIAIGAQAGQAEPAPNRRMKVDIHALDPVLVAKALDGAMLHAVLPGRDRHGAPACATQAPVDGWRAL